jgi:hypothetical protein
MSIAVSAVVKPSRLLRASLAACAAAHAGAGFALAAGAGAPARPGLLAGACLLCAVLLLRQALRRPKVRRIDISGLGEIRLTVQQESRAVPSPVVLQAASTLWPQLLLLLLRRQEGGGLVVLPVLPDSVAPGAFRALAVALRCVAERDNKFFRNNKIL